jgi:predicted transcriptional regulator
MTKLKPLTGDLQTQIMPVLWRLEAATVEQVQSVLDGASLEARQVALARLVGRLEPTELRELHTLAREIGRPLDHRVS